MAVTMKMLEVMEQQGLIAAGRSILDFGSSNFYDGTVDSISSFVRRHNPSPRPDLEVWAERLAADSGTDSAGNALNRAFVGELLEAAGMRYDSIDLADGYKTTILDMNRSRLPDEMVGAYDTVLNCGTSEHILNQLNVFESLHPAMKTGGMIYHSVPGAGHVSHGYFTYTGRFFFDLAGYNAYEVVDTWLDGPFGDEDPYLAVRQYQAYFPAVRARVEKIGTAERETAIAGNRVPSLVLVVILRKTREAPFVGALETSTSVGAIRPDLYEHYRSETPG